MSAARAFAVVLVGWLLSVATLPSGIR